MQGSVALEVEGAYTPADPALLVSSWSDKSLMPPTCALRLGLGDRWEIGARIANLSSLGGDVKWNFLRSSRIDLAIDPAFQVDLVRPTDDSGNTTTFSFYHVPLLVGVNLSRRVTLMVTPGVTWGFASGGSSRFNNGLRGGSDGSSTVLGRFGIGVDLRVSSNVALQPEITFLRSFVNGGYPQTIVYMIGLGIKFGAMPNYDDVGGGPPPAL